MEKKNQFSHLYLKNPVRINAKYKALSRFIPDDDEEEEPKDYRQMRRRFGENLSLLNREQKERSQNRSINIPNHVDFVEIEFFRPFDGELELFFVREYGLSPSKYIFFNKKVLFAVTNKRLFEHQFKIELRAFINGKDGEYQDRIKLIDKFRFYAASNRNISFTETLTYLELLNDGYDSRIFISIRQRLFEYLEENGIEFTYDFVANTVEASGLNQNAIQSIINNFDIVAKVNSPFTVKIVRGELGQVERQFAFTISPKNNAPVIGIIDTGISADTPLSTLIIGDERFNLTKTSVEKDETVHGTSVASFAALGNQLNTNPGQTTYYADARLLSIKVLGGQRGHLQRSKVIELIQAAHEEYGIKIFTLTVTENHRSKYDNEEVGKYAYLLDKLSFELDILVFISIGNTMPEYFYKDPNAFELEIAPNYPNQFVQDFSNLESPSESYNNITIGAIADNFEVDGFNGITPDKQFPALYTKTYNFDKETSTLTQNQRNGNLFKPDLIMQGGDYDSDLDFGNEPALNILSSQINKQGGFERNIGTSYATPLAANLAVKVIAQYPELTMQTVKALMVNNAKFPWGTQKAPRLFDAIDKPIEHIVGHGLPSEDLCVFSNNDEVTIILEDSIQMENHKIYEVIIPEFLLNNAKDNQILEIKATLCYKFKPIADNHMGYCPYHISFGVFRNRSINGAKSKDIKLKSTAKWSEDYYYKAKMLSNVQKFRVNISKENVVSEKGTFRIAVRAKTHRILPDRIQNEYKESEHPFSLVLKLKDLGANGKLYSELQAINTLEVINELDIDLEA